MTDVRLKKSRDLIIDASVGLKLVLPHEGQVETVRALVEKHRVLVPEIFWLETMNTLNKMFRRKELDYQEAAQALEDIFHTPIETLPIAPHLNRLTLKISNDLLHPAYDCFYLATAVARETIFITADKRFLNAVSKNPMYAAFVVPLQS